MRLETVEASVEKALSHKLRILAFGAMGDTGCDEALSDLFTYFSFSHHANETVLLWLMFEHLLPGSWKPYGNYFQQLEQHFWPGGKWGGSSLTSQVEGRDSCMMPLDDAPCAKHPFHVCWRAEKYPGDCRSGSVIKSVALRRLGEGFFLAGRSGRWGEEQ